LIIRAAGDGLKDEDDDHAFQKLVGDVQRVRQELAETTETADTAASDATAAAAAAAAASALAATKATAADITAALAPYALTSSIFAPTYVTTGNSGVGQAGASGVQVQLTTCVANGTGTGGMAITSGVFTAPGDGLYQVCISTIGAFTSNAAGLAEAYWLIQSSIGTSWIDRRTYSVAAASTISAQASMSALYYLTSGQSLSFYGTLSNTGGFTGNAGYSINQLGVTRLTNT
jgi:hypothetical protein